MREVTTIRSGLQGRSLQTIEQAFPDVDPLIDPLGNQVLVQMRRPKLMSAGGIALTEESKDFDSSMVRVAKVIAMGPIAFKNRNEMTPWPEGAWVELGQYVRVPSYAGVDAWRIFYSETESVQFAMFNDYDMKGRIKGDPLAVVDYV